MCDYAIIRNAKKCGIIYMNILCVHTAYYIIYIFTITSDLFHILLHTLNVIRILKNILLFKYVKKKKQFNY